MRYHMILIVAMLLGFLIVGGCGGGRSPATHPQIAPSSGGPSSPTLYPAQEQGDLLGDMDKDGDATIIDAMTILMFAVRLGDPTIAEAALANVDNNDTIDIIDAMTVLACAVRLSPWPIGHYGGGGSVDINDAMAADKPTSPISEGPGDTAVSLLETWESDLPEDITEFSNMLAQFTNVVQSNPNSSAGQLGLSLALVAAGAENAADKLGYSIFPEVGVQPVASLALSEKYAASRTINKAVAIALFRPWQAQKAGVSPQSQIPDSFLTTEEVQQTIRDHIFPVLDDAIARLDALSQAQPTTTVLITYVDPDDGETYKLYPADFDLLVAGLQLVRAFMLQLVAYDLDAGTYDWEIELWERDANNDNILTVHEYAPADPFLTLASAQDMNDAGGAIQNAMQRLVDALDNRVSGDSDEVINILIEGADISELRDIAQAALDIFSGPLTMEVEYAHYNWNTSTWSGAGADTIQINLSRIWSNPIADVKDLLPELTISENGSEKHYSFDYSGLPDATMNGVFPDAQSMNNLWEADYEYLQVNYSDIEIEINDDYPPGASPPFP